MACGPQRLQTTGATHRNQVRRTSSPSRSNSQGVAGVRWPSLRFLLICFSRPSAPRKARHWGQVVGVESGTWKSTSNNLTPATPTWPITQRTQPRPPRQIQTGRLLSRAACAGQFRRRRILYWGCWRGNRSPPVLQIPCRQCVGHPPENREDNRPRCWLPRCIPPAVRTRFQVR